MGRKIFQNGVWYHMENKIECDTEYMARERIELCPQAPMELLQELRWLYRHQELGAYLCGRGPQEREKRQDLLRQLQEDVHPAYLALAAYALLLENKNSARENKR